MESAFERPADERGRFLDKTCADDEALRRELEILLSSAENVGSFMENAAIGKVAEMFVGALESDVNIGECFNHYEIIRQLGAGGMGEVYLAEDTKLNRRVALKLLPTSLSSDQNAIRRLLREAQAAAMLDHAHICQIHEIAESKDCNFIVTMLSPAAKNKLNTKPRSGNERVARRFTSGFVDNTPLCATTGAFRICCGASVFRNKNLESAFQLQIS